MKKHLKHLVTLSNTVGIGHLSVLKVIDIVNFSFDVVSVLENYPATLTKERYLDSIITWDKYTWDFYYNLYQSKDRIAELTNYMNPYDAIDTVIMEMDYC